MEGGKFLEDGRTAKQANGRKKRDGSAHRSHRAAQLLPFLLGLVFAVSLVFCFFARGWGEEVGKKTGKAVGLAIGSYKGITEGLEDGANAGLKDALSAKDTQAKIGTTMQQEQKLQVLQVDFRLSDIYTEGRPEKEDYAALFFIPCTGIFTVDLRQSTVTVTGKDGGPFQCSIAIPKPEFKAYFDESQMDMMAEYSRNGYVGDAEKGAIAFLNSLDMLKASVTSKMVAYDVLTAQAEQAALEQVEKLARSVCGTASAVEIHFMEDEEG